MHWVSPDVDLHTNRGFLSIVDKVSRTDCLVVREALECYAHLFDRTRRYASPERGKGCSFLDCGHSSIRTGCPLRVQTV